MTNKLQDFTENYYTKYSHHIYNFVRKNDFVQSMNMTVGTFSVGKTIEFPPILKNFVAPEEFLSEEDSYELDRLFGDFYKHLLSIGILPDMVKDKQKEIADEFVNFLISEIKDPIHKQIVSLRNWAKNNDGSDIKKSYRVFKALYNYMLYLAHSGIIPEDVINSEESKQASTLYQEVLGNATAINLKSLLKPLQEFYTLIKAIYTLVNAKEFDDVEGWVELAQAHDLPMFYDVLE